MHTVTGGYMRSFKYRRIVTLLSALAGLVVASSVFAKPVNLYDQPQPNAKVVGTIDSASTMVPIISSKAGDWMKIGDPQNGNVGWIKVSDVANNAGTGSTSTGFSVTEKTVGAANGPQTYRTFQFVNPQPLTPAQVQDMEKRQAEIKQRTYDLIQNIFDNANAVYKANPNFPILVPVPVMVVPAAPQPVNTTTPPAKPAVAPRP
jgi:hypothetical protein